MYSTGKRLIHTTYKSKLPGYFVTWSCVPCLKQKPYFAKDVSLEMYDNNRWHKHTWN